MILDDIPDSLVADHVISVDKDISKVDDLAMTRDRCGDGRLNGEEPPESFADDDELAFDRRVQQWVELIIGQGLARGKPGHEPGGLLDVVETLERFKPHRGQLDPWRLPGG